MHVYDVDSEFYLLSFAFKDSDLFNDICTSLSIEDFSDERHKTIFSGLQKLYKEEQPVSTTSLSITLDKNISKAGDLNYIIEMSEALEVFEYDFLLRKIKEKTKLRGIVSFCFNSQKEIEYSNDYDTYISKVSSNAYKLFDDSEIEEEKTNSISEVLGKIKLYEKAVENQEAFQEGRKPQKVGLQTGFIDLDNILNGLLPGHFIVIGARPGEGKTSLMVNLVNNMKDKKSLIFSLEMTEEEIIGNLIFLEAGLNRKDYNEGKLSQTDIQKLYGASKAFENKKIFVNDNPILRPFELLGRARGIKNNHGLDIIFVDYLQLMRGDDKKYDNNETKVASISKELKAIAKKLNVPIVVLAQLNRKMEERSERIPNKSDLRESGSIEADADKILLLYSEEEKANSYLTESNYLSSPLLSKLKIKIGKNRQGPEGVVDLLWDKPSGKMDNIYEN